MSTGMLLLSRIGQATSYMADVLPGSVIFGLGLSVTVARSPRRHWRLPTRNVLGSPQA